MSKSLAPAARSVEAAPTKTVSHPVTAIDASVPASDDAMAYHLRDVPIPAEVLLGETTGRLAEITSMRTGSVILTNRPIGEPVDLFVNGVHLATGEIINAGGTRGLRIRKITTEG